MERRRSLCDTQFMAKRPRDPVQLAKQVFYIAIGETEDTVSESKRHPKPQRAGGIAILRLFSQSPFELPHA